MTKKLIDSTANIIRKCYSPAALAVVANELGVAIAADGDIFQALITAGRASDFGQAVEIVAAHLEQDEDAETRPNRRD